MVRNALQATPYSDINTLLEQLLSRIEEPLAEKLVGLYLYGSLVTGDFDHDISDIDLLAATASDVNEEELDTLRKLHEEFAAQNPQWDNRIEVQYFALSALKTFRSQTSQMAVVSPGEPLHFKEAGKDWLINWYIVREKGIPLFGPSPKTLIDPISKAEFMQAVKEQASAWREYIIHTQHSRRYQAYAVLTMCRALYAYQQGEQVSKKQAARWAQEQLPQWAALIQRALLLRRGWREGQPDHEATYLETARFVHFMSEQIAS